MNYLWEILLQAKRQKIESSRLQFVLPARHSPYQELSEVFLNITGLEEPYIIEINPYYRFLSVFKKIDAPDLKEYPSMRKGLFRIIMHQLGENDLKMGMTREEYYKKFLLASFREEIYGTEEYERLLLFHEQEREMILSGILTLYRTGDSLTLFQHMICSLIQDCIVYSSQEEAFCVLIYVGQKETEDLRNKVDFLMDFFLGISYQREVYYEYHFGIIDVEETMCIDAIAIC